MVLEQQRPYPAPDMVIPKPEQALDEHVRRIELEIDYARDGITVDYIGKRFQALEEEFTRQQQRRWPEIDGHEDPFYLNSSDPLDVLAQEVDVQGKKVFSVTGSGDFYEAFLLGGASEVHLFDSSWSALLYQELKYVGLQTLSRDEYIDLFADWVPKIDGRHDLNPRSLIREPFLSPELYLRLQGQLTGAARYFFDQLVFGEQQHLGQIVINGGNPRYNFHTFARTRMDGTSVRDLFPGEESYRLARDQAKKVPYQPMRGDIHKIVEAMTTPPDIAYISNIGYSSNASLQLAKKLIGSGVSRVIATWSNEEAPFVYQQNFVYNRDGVVKQGGQLTAVDIREIKAGLWKNIRLFQGNERPWQSVFPGSRLTCETIERDEDDRSISPAERCTATLLDFNPHVLYCNIMEISAAENPQWVKK